MSRNPNAQVRRTVDMAKLTLILALALSPLTSAMGVIDPCACEPYSGTGASSAECDEKIPGTECFAEGATCTFQVATLFITVECKSNGAWVSDL